MFVFYQHRIGRNKSAERQYCVILFKAISGIFNAKNFHICEVGSLEKLYIYQEIVVKPGNFVEDMFYIYISI